MVFSASTFPLPQVSRLKPTDIVASTTIDSAFLPFFTPNVTDSAALSAASMAIAAVGIAAQRAPDAAPNAAEISASSTELPVILAEIYDVTPPIKAPATMCQK